MAILKLVTKSSSEGCARALRAIGQDLARLLPENLEISVAGEDYVVRCEARRNSIQSKTRKINTFQKLLKKIVHKKSKAVRQSLSDLVPIRRTYKPEDIDRIYGVQIVDRGRVGRSPDLHSLGERLRMVGRIVQSKHGQLIKLVNKKNSVAFEYSDDHGNIHSEEVSYFALYRLQQQSLAQRRSPKDKDVWDEHDR
jgi:hypothetical protein